MDLVQKESLVVSATPKLWETGANFRVNVETRAAPAVLQHLETGTVYREACAAREETRVQMDRDASCPGRRRPRRLGCKVHRRHGPRNRTAGTHPQVSSRANDPGHAQIETGRARRQAKVQREQTEKMRQPTFKGHGEHETLGRTVSESGPEF